jgi:uncharacterized protein YfeS
MCVYENCKRNCKTARSHFLHYFHVVKWLEENDKYCAISKNENRKERRRLEKKRSEKINYEALRKIYVEKGKEDLFIKLYENEES